MSLTSRMTGCLAVLLTLVAGVTVAQTPPPSLLAPVVPRIKAAVRQAQPRASFALAPDVLIAQYHCADALIHPRDRAGHELPPYLELGPHRGGFLLEISVTDGPTPTPQVTPPTSQRPWTTVTSFYPAPDGRALVMIWEAAPGAPHGLALKVGQVLAARAAGSN